MKQRVKIITVNPETREVEFMLKDASLVSTQVWEVPSFFRWPRQNEYWTVDRDANRWILGERMENVETALKVSQLAEGEAKINTDVVYTDSGARLATVYGPYITALTSAAPNAEAIVSVPHGLELTDLTRVVVQGHLIAGSTPARISWSANVLANSADFTFYNASPSGGPTASARLRFFLSVAA